VQKVREMPLLYASVWGAPMKMMLPTIKQLSDNTPFTKVVTYDPTVHKLRGPWALYRKIDGVRALRLHDGTVVSRNSKPLYNLDHLDFTDAEVFRDNWKTSISLCRTESYMETYQSDVYQLTDETTDPRLFIGSIVAPTDDYLNDMMLTLVGMGHEGLVLRQAGVWLRVVPEKTIDIRITGYKEGTGKYAGMLGSLHTAHGNVGTGLDDSDRQVLWATREELIGQIVQVTFREVNDDTGKLRFPSFQRIRWDKTEENLEALIR
jgi:hypothetical protein